MGYALTELGAARCAQIAEGLFKVEKVYGEKLHGFCPIHGDQSSASFVYVPSGDWYKCQSCGAGGDLVKLWCEVNGLDSHGEGFKRFKEEFVGDTGSQGAPRRSSAAPPARPVDPVREAAPELFVNEEHYAALPPLPAERVTELRRVRGWSSQVIESIGLREFDARGTKKIAIPIRDDGGRLVNIRLYQPGAAQFKVISWYDPACHLCGNPWKKVEKAKVCSSCGVSPADYGRTRLFPAPSRWQRTGTIWLCEGEPDTLCALSQGLNAFTQTAGCGTWNEEFSAELAGRDVVICYDADGAGHKGAMKAAASIVEQAKSVRVLRWPELMGRVA